MSTKEQLERYLAKEAQSKIAPRLLREAGKEAAFLHVEKGLPLNDAVIKVAQSLPNPGDEHLQRIVEEANTNTFERLFSASTDKHISYDLADPEYIKQAFASSEESEEKLAEALEGAKYTPADLGFFDTEPEEAYVNQEFELSNEYIKLSSALNELQVRMRQLDADCEEQVSKLAGLVRDEILSGTTAAEIVEVFGYASSNREQFRKIAHAMGPFINSAERGEFRNQIPNDDHPMFTQYQVVEGLLKQASVYQRAINDVNSTKSDILKRIRGEDV